MWQSLKNVYHLLVAVLANVWFGFPSRKLTVIGVTGTDGKTTTTHLIYHILKTAGKNVSLVSSVKAVINEKDYQTGFHVTTPSSWQLQSFLGLVAGPAARQPHAYPTRLTRRGPPPGAPRLASPAAEHPILVLEVTSHALDQHRVWGIDFRVGVLTNVTHEHLDYHKTYKNYVLAKAKLLEKAKVVVVNRDDESHEIINSKFKIQNSKLQFKSPAKGEARQRRQKLITYGIKNRAEVTPESFSFKTKLPGEFNRYNVLAAIAATRALGIDKKIIQKAILSFNLPEGRLEVIYDRDFRVIIDMAHTPNGLENVLAAVGPTVQGRLIHIFGSAGERDKTKRPKMGEASAKYADIIILTAEDPRSESAEKIINEIESGIKNYELRIKKGTLLKIPDRQEAITAAIKLAKKGDLVLLTGKGHEKSMTYGKKDFPWSEHAAIKKALKQN